MASTERAPGVAEALVEALINECERVGRQQRMSAAMRGAIDTSAGERARDALLGLLTRYEAALDRIAALPEEPVGTEVGPTVAAGIRAGRASAALIAREARGGGDA